MGGIVSAGLSAEVILLVVLCMAAVAVALVGAVRGAISPGGSALNLLAGPLTVGVVAVAILGMLSTGWDPGEGPVLQQRAVSHGAAAFALPMVGLPAVAASVLAVVWSGWAGPRRWGAAGWVLAPGWTAAAALAFAGWGQPDMVFSLLRAASLAGVAAVLALGAGRDDARGVALRAVALGCLVVVTAALETSHEGLVTLITVAQVGELTPDTWEQGLEAFEAIVAPSRVASWGALVGLVCAAAASLPRAPRGVQAGVVAACLLGLALLGLSRPSHERMGRLSVLCPEAPPTSR